MSNNRNAPDSTIALPLRAPDFFLAEAPPATRRTLLLAYGVLLLLALGTVLAQYFPYEAFTHYASQATGTTRQVVLGYTQGTTHAFPYVAEAFMRWVHATGEPLHTGGWLYWALAAMWVVGWACALTATSRMALLPAHGVLFTWGLWLNWSNVAPAVGLPNPYGLGTLVLALPVLALFYLHRQRVLRLSTWGQWLSWLALLGLAVGVLAAAKGTTGVAQLVITPVLVGTLLALAGALALGRELTSLPVLMASQAAEAHRRWPASRLALVHGLLLLLLLLALLRHEGYLWAWAPGLAAALGWLSPTWLWALAAVVHFFTAQNAYHQVEGWLHSRAAFTLALLGLHLLGLAYLAYLSLDGHQLLLHRLQTVALRALVVFAVVHVLYVWVHFGPWLRRRECVFPVLLEPPRPTPLRWLVAWFIVLTMTLFIEGRSQWYTFQLMVATQQTTEADLQWRQGSLPAAQAAYNRAGQLMRIIAGGPDPKVAYQEAVLSITDQTPPASLEATFTEAEQFFDFPPARVMYGALWLERGGPQYARRFLSARLGPTPDPWVLLTLGEAYRQTQQPDSAHWAWEAASQHAAVRTWALANRAMLYLSQGNLTESARVAEELQGQAPGPAAEEALTVLRLAQQGPAAQLMAAPEYVPDSLARAAQRALPGVTAALAADTLAPPPTRFNRALRALALRQHGQANQLITNLARQGEGLHQLMVRLLSLGGLDTLPPLPSRLEYLLASYPHYAALTHHNYATLWYEKGVPELAAVHYAQAAARGYTPDSLRAAYALAEAGDLGTALTLLNEIQHRPWAQASTLPRERLLMLTALGQVPEDQPTALEVELLPSEQLRLASYLVMADQQQLLQDLVNQMTRPQDVQRMVLHILKQAHRLEPRWAHTLAQAVYAADSTQPALQLALAQRAWRVGQAGTAERLAAQLARAPLATDSLNWEYQLLSAHLQLVKGADSLALPVMQRLLAQRPTHLELRLLLAETLSTNGQHSDAYNLLMAWADVNPHSPYLWKELAPIAWRGALTEAGDLAAERAVALMPNSETAESWQAEMEITRRLLVKDE